MNIKIIAVGKLKEKYLKQGIDEYAKRLGAYCKLDIVEVADEKTPDTMSEKEMAQVKAKEAERIASKIGADDYVISLAIEGELVTSESLASKLDWCGINGKSKVTFIIGGSLGLCDSIKKRSDVLISFGRITLPHQLIRLVLTEQIYRTFRINNNQAYHK